MAKIYLFGYPLSHSISPAFQNAALEAKGICGVVYEKLPLPPERMGEMIDALKAEDCLGANVTIPHKQTIIAQLDELSEVARDIGAVNTVVKRQGKLIGDNTDAYGFIQALKVRGIHPRHARAMIIGAGGAAAATAYALTQEGAREMIVVNRTIARAAELADRLHARFPHLELAVNDWDALTRMHLIVNASAIGMSPRQNESPIPQHRTIKPGQIVFDLVYNPPETPLLREAARAGARGIGGLEMLVYQGARSFELWTGKDAPVEVMQSAAEGALREMMEAERVKSKD